MSEIRYILTIKNQKGKTVERKVGKYKKSKSCINKKITVYIDNIVKENGHLIETVTSYFVAR